ncbi:MAG: hypothetical protein ACI8ZM_003685 [Crocinitomix sp.]|jgi:hypothetical protein
MIPVLKMVFIIGGLFFFSIHASAKIHNRLEEIAAKYNIYPFNLEYGYPMRYKWDDRPIRGIIYLSNEIEYLEKLDGRTYVGQPTLENAEIIANFSAEPIDFPKYYVIVDHTVVQSELAAFLEKLMNNEMEMEICFVGGNGRYVSVKYDNWSSMYDPSVIVCFQFTNVFEVMMNANDDLLIEGRITNIDSVHKRVKHCYSANIYAEDQDYNQIDYSKRNMRYVTEQIRRIESEITENPDNKYLLHERGRLKKMTRLVEKFDEFSEPPRSFYVRLEKQQGTTLNGLYMLLNQIQYGVHLARANYFKKRFNGSYLELFYSHDPIYLELLEFTFPDRMMEKIEYWGEPPPPLIEVIDEAPEPRLWLSGCGTVPDYEESRDSVELNRFIDVTESEEELNNEYLQDSL